MPYGDFSDTALLQALSILVQVPGGLRLPHGRYPSGASAFKWNVLERRRLILRDRVRGGILWRPTLIGEKWYRACIAQITQDFAEAIRDELGEWIELPGLRFADRLVWIDVPRWENEGGALGGGCG